MPPGGDHLIPWPSSSLRTPDELPHASPKQPLSSAEDSSSSGMMQSNHHHHHHHQHSHSSHHHHDNHHHHSNHHHHPHYHRSWFSITPSIVEDTRPLHLPPPPSPQQQQQQQQDMVGCRDSSCASHPVGDLEDTNTQQQQQQQDGMTHQDVAQDTQQLLSSTQDVPPGQADVGGQTLSNTQSKLQSNLQSKPCSGSHSDVPVPTPADTEVPHQGHVIPDQQNTDPTPALTLGQTCAGAIDQASPADGKCDSARDQTSLEGGKCDGISGQTTPAGQTLEGPELGMHGRLRVLSQLHWRRFDVVWPMFCVGSSHCNIQVSLPSLRNMMMSSTCVHALMT